MTEIVFQAFGDEAIPAHATEKIASGEWAASDALALSKKSFDELLPQGLATPDNHLFSIVDEINAAIVGMVWIAVRTRGDKRIAYLYEIKIHPKHQRKGHAGRTLVALEEKVFALGLSGLALHVFGHNAAARALYVKHGYLPTNINMFKAI